MCVLHPQRLRMSEKKKQKKNSEKEETFGRNEMHVYSEQRNICGVLHSSNESLLHVFAKILRYVSRWASNFRTRDLPNRAL